jgi:uncharacterized protein YjbI with pentapeptide repeats
MTRSEQVALLKRGAAAWTAGRAGRGDAPDLCDAAPRGLDMSSLDLSRADLRGADLRGARMSDTNLVGARLEGANLFKAVLGGADLAGVFLSGAQFLNWAQLAAARNWQSAFRDNALGCGAPIPEMTPS